MGKHDPTPNQDEESSSKKIGCSGFISRCLVFLFIVLLGTSIVIFVGYVRDPDGTMQSLDQAWHFWVVNSWVGASWLEFTTWIQQTAFWKWVTNNLAIILLVTCVLVVLGVVGSIMSDVTGDDNKGCVLLGLCLLCPPLFILVLLLWCFTPKEESE